MVSTGIYTLVFCLAVPCVSNRCFKLLQDELKFWVLVACFYVSERAYPLLLTSSFKAVCWLLVCEGLLKVFTLTCFKAFF